MGHDAGVLHRIPRVNGVPSAGPGAQLLGAARMLSLAIQEAVEARLHAELAGDRLSRSQWKLLEIFATTPVANVTEVAAYLGVSTAAASKAVDRLARQNLLERSIDTQDRRHVRLALSPEGGALVSTFLERLQLRLNEIWGDAEGEELAGMGSALDRLTASVMRAAGNPSETCIQCELNRRAACLVKESLHRDCFFHTLHRDSPAAEATPAARL